MKLLKLAVLSAALLLPSVSYAGFCTNLAYASIAADVGTTIVALNRGYEEANPVYGKNPSNYLIVGGGLARSNFAAVLDKDKKNVNHIAGFMIGISIPLGTMAIFSGD
jgi:hypothetical protein